MDSPCQKSDLLDFDGIIRFYSQLVTFEETELEDAQYTEATLRTIFHNIIADDKITFANNDYDQQ